MPGIIRVSGYLDRFARSRVLEAVDIPETLTDGTTGKDVTTKVTLGPRQFKTESRVADGGKIDSWNSDFAFPVTNLRDKLVISVCDNEDYCLTQTSIEVPSIIEKGSRDEFVELKGGGRIHLTLSFVLTDEERKKIENMRLAVIKRREEERVKRTIVFQNVQTNCESKVKAAPISAVTITDIDDSTTDESKDFQEIVNKKGFGSTTKPLTPRLMFDYGRAVGLQTRQNLKTSEMGSKFWEAENVSNEVKFSIDDIKSDEQNVRESCKVELEVGSSENAILDFSRVSSRTLQRSTSSLTRSTGSTSSLIVPPSVQGPFSGKVTSGAVNNQVGALGNTFLEGQDEYVVPLNNEKEDKWRIEGQRVWSVLQAEAAAISNSLSEQSSLAKGEVSNSDIKRDITHLAFRDQMQRWDGQHTIQAGYIVKEIAKLEGQSGQGLGLEARPGPGARWARKTGLETRWASHSKVRPVVRVEWNGQVSDPFKARAKILELVKAVAGSHEVYGADRSFQERHNLADTFGAVLNKVVGGAVVLLASMFMMWPLAEGSPYGSDGSRGGDIRIASESQVMFD